MYIYVVTVTQNNYKAKLVWLPLIQYLINNF